MYVNCLKIYIIYNFLRNTNVPGYVENNTAVYILCTLRFFPEIVGAVSLGNVSHK